MPHVVRVAKKKKKTATTTNKELQQTFAATVIALPCPLMQHIEELLLQELKVECLANAKTSPPLNSFPISYKMQLWHAATPRTATPPNPSLFLSCALQGVKNFATRNSRSKIFAIFRFTSFFLLLVLFFVANLLQHLPRAAFISGRVYLSATLNLLCQHTHKQICLHSAFIIFRLAAKLSSLFAAWKCFAHNFRIFAFSRLTISHFHFNAHQQQQLQQQLESELNVENIFKIFPKALPACNAMTFAIFRTFCILLNCLSHVSRGQRAGQRDTEREREHEL